MQRYFIRSLKSILLFFLFGTLAYVLVFYTGTKNSETQNFWDFVCAYGNLQNMIIFFTVFGLVYPLIGYVKQKVYASKSFDEYKEEVVCIFSRANFVLISDKDKKMVFRPKSGLLRLTRLYEDAIEVDYSDTPVLVNGLRRDAYRLSRRIQDYIRNVEKEKEE